MQRWAGSCRVRVATARCWIETNTMTRYLSRAHPALTSLPPSPTTAQGARTHTPLCIHAYAPILLECASSFIHLYLSLACVCIFRPIYYADNLVSKAAAPKYSFRGGNEGRSSFAFGSIEKGLLYPGCVRVCMCGSVYVCMRACVYVWK
jgi:hypothetical protein